MSLMLLLQAPSGIALEGAAVAQPSATGALTTEIQLAAAVAAAASAQGALTTGIPLAATVQAAVSAQGDLTTAIQLASQAQAQAGAAGDLTTSIRLEAAIAAASSALGEITTAIQLASQALAQAAAAGDLTLGPAAPPIYRSPQLIALPWRLKDLRDYEYERELRERLERRRPAEIEDPELERLLEKAADAGFDEDEVIALLLAA